VKRPDRKLTREEAALWAKVTQSVTPMERPIPPPLGNGPQAGPAPGVVPNRKLPLPPPLRVSSLLPSAGQELRIRTLDRQGLDASWDRKLSHGLVQPDFTLDLHGATLDAAHARLEHGLTLALAHGARLVLLITGRHRPSDDRTSRGVIRRKFMDWLAAGPHAGRIAAVRPAHHRHGGSGAVYIVLRKPR
jgi:DNA-nicking Smr family endonuclease